LDAGLLRSPQSAAVESHRRLRWITILCAGQARRSSRSIAQSLRSGVSPEAERVPTGKPSRRAGPVRARRYRVATGGLAPTASGANSVASALGASPGATPARLCEHTMRVAPLPLKPELSTWLGVGTFYLAPTEGRSYMKDGAILGAGLSHETWACSHIRPASWRDRASLFLQGLALRNKVTRRTVLILCVGAKPSILLAVKSTVIFN